MGEVEWDNAVGETLEAEKNPGAVLERPKVLFVDDESHILKAVNRLFEDEPFEVITCASGEEGRKWLQKERFAVLISDQRMPGMSGSELLQWAQMESPETVRIMLTGNNDVNTAMDAINRGAVFRFVTKPWEREEFLHLMSLAVEHHELMVSKVRYEAHIERQNEKLRRLNDELESRVEERTSELVAKQQEVVGLYQELQTSFDATIRALMAIMELGEIQMVEHCRRTAERVNAFVEELGWPLDQQRDLERAARLHWLGLINAPPGLFAKTVDEFDAVERATWDFHPLLGQQAIQLVPELREAGRIILHYLHRYDAPEPREADEWEGEAPTPELLKKCQVLAICSAFEQVRTRIAQTVPGETDAAAQAGAEFLKRERGRAFDPELVDRFLVMTHGERATSKNREQEITVAEVRVGMVLSRPLQTIQGIPVAPRDMIVTEGLLARLRRFQKASGLQSIFVWI